MNFYPLVLSTDETNRKQIANGSLKFKFINNYIKCKWIKLWLKNRDCLDWIKKQDPTICSLWEIHFKYKVTNGKQKVGKRYHANTMLKKTVEALLISEWIDFKMIKR